MRNVVLNVPDDRADEFIKKLAGLMKENGVEVQESPTKENDYVPMNGDFVAFGDGSNEVLFVGIFKEWYYNSRDKIICYAHMEGDLDEHDEEEYWNADILRPATDEEKENLVKALARNKKCWNPATKEFDECETYEAIRTYEDAFNKVAEMAEHGDKLAEGLVKDLQFNSPYTPDLLAYIKLRIVVHAINEGWTPKFSKGEYRWFPWFWLYTKEEVEAMDEEQRSKLLYVGGNADNLAHCGLSYANSDSGFSLSSTSIGARLAFYDKRRAEYAGQQFLELYRDLNFLPPQTDEVTE